MTSRCLLLVFAFAVACADDVTTIHVSTTATVRVTLAPVDDHIPDQFGHYYWKLVASPPDAMIAPPDSPTATISVFPIRRGLYVYDRWWVGQSAEELTCHVILTVDGAPPAAHIVGPSSVAVGASSVLDGSTSTSPEHRALEYEWRLATSPESSTVTLADVKGQTMTFTPDVKGDYDLELRVFDGELWSAAAMATVSAQ